MINILFLLGLAQASDVYEGCVVTRQTWSDIQQDWNTTRVDSYYSQDPVQFIIHKNTFEVNRYTRNIESKYNESGNQCWKEHKNSFFCFIKEDNLIIWEFHHRNGDVTRDVMKICKINGEEP